MTQLDATPPDSGSPVAGTARLGPASVPGPHDAAVINLLTRHLDGEAELLDAYAEVSREHPNEFVRYVAGLILEDERRHHTIVEGMINHLRTGVDLVDGSPRVPFVTHVTDKAHLRARVRELQRFERHDAIALWKLRRKLGLLGHSTLLGPLVDALASDTRKHRRLLRSLHRLANS